LHIEGDENHPNLSREAQATITLRSEPEGSATISNGCIAIAPASNK